MNNIPAEPLSHADYVRLLVKADAEIARLRVALEAMLLHDHAGLRGLVYAKAKSRKPEGWTDAQVHTMQHVCREARAVLRPVP